MLQVNLLRCGRSSLASAPSRIGTLRCRLRDRQGRRRDLSYADAWGGSKIKERLTGTEETSYSYAIVESSLPVKNYKATLSVEEDEDSPDRSEIHWEATFDAQGTSEDVAREKIAEILEAGLAGMKKVAIEYEIKNPDAPAGEAYPSTDTHDK
jgi:hypothetical protein